MDKGNFSIIKKITVKTVCGVIKAPSKDVNLMRVVGIATGVKSGESNYGPWQAMRGQFQATCLETGEIFRSGVCILPGVAQDLLIPQLYGTDTKGVEFGMEIGIRPSEVPIGYEYTCNPLFQMDNDPLANVLMRLPEVEQRKALPDTHDKKGRK